jgi:hypothetical protein
MHGGLRGNGSATGSGVDELLLIFSTSLFFSGCLLSTCGTGIVLCSSDFGMSNWFLHGRAFERLQWKEVLSERQNNTSFVYDSTRRCRR